MNVNRQTRRSPEIHYYPHTTFPGWLRAPAFLASLVDDYQPKTLFEIGSGANPTLDIADVVSRGIRYTTSDLSEDELKKAPAGYDTRCLDLEAPSVPADLIGTCDMVFSRMVNEHIRDGRRYHTNILNMLAPGGRAVHCFSTLYAMPFLTNFLMPECLSQSVLKFVMPRDEHKLGKFRAYYSWSRGPTRRMIQRFQDVGFDVITYNGYFGHDYYRLRFPLLHRLEQVKAKFLVNRPNPNLSAFAMVILQKPR